MLKFTTLNIVESILSTSKLQNINNIRHRPNIVVEFHNVDQRRNNVVNMTICKYIKRAKNMFQLKN